MRVTTIIVASSWLVLLACDQAPGGLSDPPTEGRAQVAAPLATMNPAPAVLAAGPTACGPQSPCASGQRCVQRKGGGQWLWVCEAAVQKPDECTKKLGLGLLHPQKGCGQGQTCCHVWDPICPLGKCEGAGLVCVDPARNGDRCLAE